VRRKRGSGSALGLLGAQRESQALSLFIAPSIRFVDGGVTASPNGLQCPHELGGPRNHVDAMKREHDTEPGPPDITEESAPPSQSKPRQITARGLGNPDAPPPPSTTEDAKTDSADEIVVPRKPARKSDTMDDAILAITRRRHRFPVSLEPGRTEHAPLREPPSSNDTLPTLGKVVLNTPTDPGARQRDEPPGLAGPAGDTPKPSTARTRHVVLGGAALALAIGVALIAMRERADVSARALDQLAPVVTRVAASAASPESLGSPPSASALSPALTASTSGVPTAAPKPPTGSPRMKEKPSPKPSAESPSAPNATDIERITPY